MSSSSEQLQNMQNELKWVSVKEESQKTFMGKMESKFKKNPLIPIGVISTAVILAAGLKSFYQQDKIKQQKYMRLRVLSQGLTIAVTIVSMYLSGAYKNN